MRGRWSLLAILVVAGCQPAAETPEAAKTRMDTETAAARQAIEAANTKLTAHLAAGHGDSCATFYADDGRLMPPNGKAAVGRAAIAGVFSSLGKAALTLTTEDVVANGPVALERGAYKMTITPASGPAVTENGKYLVHWHRVGDQWKLVDDIWNSDNPAMAPMPEPTAKKK